MDWIKRLKLRRETNRLLRQSHRQFGSDKYATLKVYWEKVNQLRVLEHRQECRKG
jgi:hypothetical protein